MTDNCVVLDRPGTAMCECGGQVAMFLRHQEGGYVVKCFECNLSTIIPVGSEYAHRIAKLLRLEEVRGCVEESGLDPAIVGEAIGAARERGEVE